MGGRSNRSSGGSSVPKASASGAMGMYDNMLGGQLGTISEAMGGLVDQGMQFMEDNPGKHNFIRAIGGMPIQLDTPGFMQDFIDRYRPEEPVQPEPYDINEDMRIRMGMGTPYGPYSPQRTSMFGGR